MPVITIGELKARFAAGDQPSEKDFMDLIDTLLAGIGAQPSGAAGGDLDGEYPDPVIAPGAVTTDKFQEINTNRLLGRGSAAIGDVEEITVGDGLTLTGTVLTSTAAGGGTTPNVSGSIVAFSGEADIDEDVLIFQAPASFGNSMPQSVRVVARFIQPFSAAGYLYNDEVPIEWFRINLTPFPPAIVSSVYLSGGLITVSVKVDYGTFTGSPLQGIAVCHKTDFSTTALVPFTNAADVEAKVSIKVYMTRAESGTGFGSISKYDPAVLAVPADTVAAEFTHDFGVQPDLPVRVTLQCTTVDLGYAVGDEVPIDQAFETGFTNPAFGVTITTAKIIAQRNATTIDIPHKTTGVLTTITDASWKVKAAAYRTTNVPTLVFPATSFQLMRPVGAFSYQETMYVWHLPYDNVTHLSKINLTNGVITPIFTYESNRGIVNTSFHRFNNGGSPVDCLVWTDNRGVHRMRLDNGTRDTIYPATGGPISREYWFPLAFSEVPTATFTRPDFILCIRSGVTDDAGHHYRSHAADRFLWSGTAYSYAAQTTLDWTTYVTDTTFLTYHPLSSGSPHMVLCQYNPIKKRVYFMASNSLVLSVFKFNNGTSMFDWWTVAAPTLGVFDYETTIAVPGLGPDGQYYGAVPRFSVEFDGVTGAEKSITFNTYGAFGVYGSVTRVPWTE